MNLGIQLLYNNSCTADRIHIRGFKENDTTVFNNLVVKQLYDSVLSRKNVNFDTIPQSKGDIKKYTGYTCMMDSINLLQQLLDSEKTTSTDFDNLKAVIMLLEDNSKSFVNSFKTNNNLGILLYNSMVSCCVEATTILLTAFVDYVKDPGSATFAFKPNARTSDSAIFKTLRDFIKLNKNNTIEKTLKYAETYDPDEAIKEAIDFKTIQRNLEVGSIVVFGLIGIIIAIREMVFLIYYSRMKISDFLNYQKNLLELQELKIEAANTIDPKKRDKILDRQQKIIGILDKLYDKIKIKEKVDNKAAKMNLEMDDKKLSYKNLDNERSKMIL